MLQSNVLDPALACRLKPHDDRAGLHAPGLPRREITVAFIALAAEYGPLVDELLSDIRISVRMCSARA